MKIKKIFIGICLVTSMIGLVGCGASNETKKTSNKNGSEEIKKEEKESTLVYFKEQSDFNKNSVKEILSKCLSFTSLSRKIFDGIDTVEHDGFITKYKIADLYMAKDFHVARNKIKVKVENEILMIIEANVEISKESIYYNEKDLSKNKFIYYVSIWGQNFYKENGKIVISSNSLATGTTGNGIADSVFTYEGMLDTTGRYDHYLNEVKSKESKFEEATSRRWFRDELIDENEYVLEKIEIK